MLIKIKWEYDKHHVDYVDQDPPVLEIKNIKI